MSSGSETLATITIMAISPEPLRQAGKCSITFKFVNLWAHNYSFLLALAHRVRITTGTSDRLAASFTYYDTNQLFEMSITGVSDISPGPYYVLLNCSPENSWFIGHVVDFQVPWRYRREQSQLDVSWL